MAGDATDDLTGRILGGKYRIVRPIAEGGMGTVYEAMQEGLGRRVALKVVRPEFANHSELLERFRREALSSAALGHPNIVQVTDFFVGDVQTPPFLVMEYLDGADLIRIVNTEGPMSPARAAAVGIQVLAALAAAHDAGIVHRDLKASNIILVPVADGSDLVKVVDFGIAKVREGPGFTKLTGTGVIVGTPGYLAPEQALGKEVDGRADLYALAVVLYIALTANKPFVALSEAMLLTKTVKEPPTPMRTHRPELDPAFCEVIERALAKDPDDRYENADAMAAALKPWVERTSLVPGRNSSAPAPAMSPRTSAPSSPPRNSSGPPRDSLGSPDTVPQRAGSFEPPPSSVDAAHPSIPHGQSPAAISQRRFAGRGRVLAAVIALVLVGVGVVTVVLLTVFMWSSNEHVQATPVPGATPPPTPPAQPNSPTLPDTSQSTVVTDKPMHTMFLSTVATNTFRERDIRMRFQHRMDEVNRCFAVAVPAMGEQSWEIHIDDRGRMQSADYRAAPALPSVNACMQGLFAAIGFPAEPNGGKVLLTFAPG